MEIKKGKNTFSVDVDDEHYEIELMPKAYTAKELISHINKQLEAGDVPPRAYEDGGRLKLMHESYGKHKIKHLSGAVKNALLFAEKGEWFGNQPMRLRASGVSGDWIEVDKPWIDTTSLGINTLAAESRIRDADISKEAVQNSIQSILEQADASMMAQIMQNSKLALQLLQ